MSIRVGGGIFHLVVPYNWPLIDIKFRKVDGSDIEFKSPEKVKTQS